MSEFTPYGEVSMGTTNLLLRYNGGVLIASDTRTTRGAFIEDRNARKSNDISPSVARFGPIFVVRSGNAAHTQVLTRIVANYVSFHSMELPDSEKIDIDTVANIYQTICYNNKDYVSGSFVLTNGKRIVSVHKSGAIFDHELCFGSGSGSTFVDGFVKNSMRANMPLPAVEKVAVEAMARAIDIDTASGGNCYLVDVKEDGTVSKKVVFNEQMRQLVRDMK